METHQAIVDVHHLKQLLFIDLQLLFVNLYQKLQVLVYVSLRL